MILYHGSTNDFTELSKEFVFFSTSKDFAENYGIVKEFKINAMNVFDSLNQEHIEQLINSVGALYDAYDEVFYEGWEEYKNHPYFDSDTWEIIEPHLNVIKRLGYDTVIIYEGGCQNYITLNGGFEIKKS